MTEAEKAYQYFVVAVPENEEQAKAYFWARKALHAHPHPAERVGERGGEATGGKTEGYRALRARWNVCRLDFVG